ncbi:MAG: L-lysine dehydrogenase, partial [Nitrospinaceae bacterium]
LILGGRSWRAISWTTAASVCSVLELVSRGELPRKGFLKQEEIPLKSFFNTSTGALYLKNAPVH